MTKHFPEVTMSVVQSENKNLSEIDIVGSPYSFDSGYSPILDATLPFMSSCDNTGNTS